MRGKWFWCFLVGFSLFKCLACDGANGVSFSSLRNKRESSGEEQVDQKKLAQQLAEISANAVSPSNGMTYDDLDTWVAPYEIRKNYAYYVAGYDNERRPIFIEEFGKWDFRKVVEIGGETLKDFDKYVAQVCYRVGKTVKESGTPDEPVDGAIIIMDMADFNIRQLTHLPTAAYFIRMARTCQKVIFENLYVGIGLNTNAIAQSLLSFIKPHFGGIFEKMEVFGTNPAKWKPHVLKYCPKDQIPEWYGGSKNFKPVVVYG